MAIGDTARRVATAPLTWLDTLGDQLSFYLRALAWIPRTLRRYTRERPVDDPSGEPTRSRS